MRSKNFKFQFTASGKVGYIILTDENIIGALKQLDRYVRWNDLHDFKIKWWSIVRGTFSKGKMLNKCFA